MKTPQKIEMAWRNAPRLLTRYEVDAINDQAIRIHYPDDATPIKSVSALHKGPLT